jgi:predicted nucleic acid-binding protein
MLDMPGRTNVLVCAHDRSAGAMVVRAASESGAEVIWSEHLNDGQEDEGVTVRNPFSKPPR